MKLIQASLPRGFLLADCPNISSVFTSHAHLCKALTVSVRKFV